MTDRQVLWVARIATAAGVVLLLVLVVRTGPDVIVSGVRQIGLAGFSLLIVLSGGRHLARTVAWRLSFPPEVRSVPFLELFAIRLASEAVTDLTVAGPLLGESAKVAAVARRVPAVISASSVAIENVCYSSSVALLVVTGTLACAVRLELPMPVRAALIAFVVAVPVAAIVFLVAVARRVRFARRVLAARRDVLVDFADRVQGFFSSRRETVAGVLGLELLAGATGIIEAFVILESTTAAATMFGSFVVESANRTVNAVFALVPLRVGADEGGTALVFAALGLPLAAGIALALIRRLRSLVWIAAGLACLAWLSVRRVDAGTQA